MLFHPFGQPDTGLAGADFENLHKLLIVLVFGPCVVVPDIHTVTLHIGEMNGTVVHIAQFQVVQQEIGEAFLEAVLTGVIEMVVIHL